MSSEVRRATFEKVLKAQRELIKMLKRLYNENRFPSPEEFEKLWKLYAWSTLGIDSLYAERRIRQGVQPFEFYFKNPDDGEERFISLPNLGTAISLLEMRNQSSAPVLNFPSGTVPLRVYYVGLIRLFYRIFPYALERATRITPERLRKRKVRAKKVWE